MDRPDINYYGGNVWQAPNLLKYMIVLLPMECEPYCKFILITNPANPGSSVDVNYAGPDETLRGKWMFTLKELKIRLEGWKHKGTHVNYIDYICEIKL